MKAITLLYHDAAEENAPDASGYPGPGPAVYKLPTAQMSAHFDVLAAAGFKPTSALDHLEPAAKDKGTAAFITFDDGGISAIEVIAGLLEARGWIGHFFVTTDVIGRPTFLTAENIQDLDRRGHVIGSHSHTHPARMSSLSPAQLREEWATSVRILSELLDRPVVVASVPGGFYSRAVAEAAGEAGLRVLFTSEPVKTVSSVGECVVMGRYSITRGMTAEQAVALSAAGRSSEQIRQYLFWNLKKAVKTVGGDHYLRLRRYLLRD